MANQEVIDAIRETVKPNGVKAINADSLANLLELMAEKMGESTGSGTGSGAVRVHISAGQDLDFSQVNFEGGDVGGLTPEEVELIKNMLAKAQQDNKAAYKLLNEHREQGIADLVMGDESLFITVTLLGTVRIYNELINQYYPELSVDWSAFSFNGVASSPMFYANGKSDTSGIDADSLALLYEFFGNMLLDIENGMLNGIVLSYESSTTPYYVLKEDGSVFYFGDTSTEYERLIYVPGNGVELTEDEIEANKKAYDNLPVQSSFVEYWQIKEKYSGGRYISRGGYIHEASQLSNSDTSYSYGRFWKGKDMWEVRVYEDGNATLEVYASINPTATE